MDSSLASGRNCLGCASRETGHRRLPTPPDKRTGTNMAYLASLLVYDRDSGHLPSRHCRPEPARSHHFTRVGGLASSRGRGTASLDLSPAFIKIRNRPVTNHIHMPVQPREYIPTTTLLQRNQRTHHDRKKQLCQGRADKVRHGSTFWRGQRTTAR